MTLLRNYLLIGFVLMLTAFSTSAQIAPGESNIYLEFDGTTSTSTFSEEWSAPRVRQDGVSYRFMTAPEASITVPLAPGSYYMNLHLSSVGSSELRDSMTLTVNDQPVEMEINSPLDIVATISETVIDDMWPVRIGFSVNPDVLAALQAEQNAPIGLGFDHISLAPVAERDFAFPVTASRIELQFDDYSTMLGFGPPRRTSENISYRYMVEAKAGINLRVPGNDSILRVKFSSVGSADLLNSLQLTVNDEAITLQKIGDRFYEASIPGRLLSDTGTNLTFAVDAAALSAVQTEANSTAVGLGFDWLGLQPLGERDVLLPRPQRQIVINFDETLPMLGFDVPRKRSSDGITYRFMSAQMAVIRANLVTADYQLQLKVAGVGSGDLARSLRLTVNGEPVDLSFDATEGYRATIPAALVSSDLLTLLTFTVDQSALLAVQEAATADSGIAFDELTLTAVSSS